MSLINQDRNSSCPKHILEKIIQIYENFDLDIEDMTSEEISRICKHYCANPSQLEEDIKKSKLSKYSNNKSITKLGSKYVK